MPLDELCFHGSGLQRPECVLATARGDLFAADWRGGVAHVRPDGSQALYASALPAGRPLRPNGIALRRDGSFLLADLGETLGGVFALERDGQVRPFLETVDGVALPPTNYVGIDALDRVWITVSTRKQPRALDYRPDCATGFVVLADSRGARIVADGLGYTNEAVVSPDGRWLYVNETFARRTSRFAIRADGALGPKEVVTTFGKGTFPDGLAFDGAGHAWITSVVSNRVIRVAPDGTQHLVLEDTDASHVDWCEEAYLGGTMGRPHLDRAAGRVLKNISSLAFGGSDLRTAYLGCLLGDSIASFRSPVAGHPPAHWNWG
ncbi:MAG TPA: SMP-30/gluconolactonase/LRE family protein [Burkholderiales bacterium]|nr:SMP-30/gluconolactonase/LRE family protein [Burkholderiales bacterium]